LTKTDRKSFRRTESHLGEAREGPLLSRMLTKTRLLSRRRLNSSRVKIRFSFIRRRSKP